MQLDVGDYRRKAESDLRQIEYNAKEDYILADTSCVHAQQYVEKMIKEKIVEFGHRETIWTHDLSELLKRFSKMSGIPIDSVVEECASDLSGLYITARYPGTHDEEGDITPDMARVAHLKAVFIVDWIDRYHPSN